MPPPHTLSGTSGAISRFSYRTDLPAAGYVHDGFFTVDRNAEEAPFVGKRTGGHWDITGRGVGGSPMLPWLDSVQVKGFAWAAEYPETTLYSK